jgi:hypothetical protein
MTQVRRFPLDRGPAYPERNVMEILSISLQAAFAAAVTFSLVAIAIRGLRRASRKVNEILCSELSPEIGSDRHTRHSRVEDSPTPQRKSLLSDRK